MNASGETHRRLTLTDAYKDAQHVIDQLTTRSSAEPSASASIETTAKGEPKPDVKVYAPIGCDYEALAEHARQVTDVAVEAYGRAVAALAKITADEGMQL